VTWSLSKNKHMLFIASCFLFMIFLGAYYTGYQTLIDVVAGYFNTPAAALGFVMSIHFYGAVTGPAFSAEISERLGKKAVLIGGTLLISVGGIVMCLTQGIFLAGLAIFMIGIGFTASEAMVVSIMSDAFGPKATRAISFLYIIFDIGALAAPLIIVYVFDFGRQFRAVYLCCAVISIILIAGFSLCRFGEKPKEKLAGSLATLLLVQVKAFRYTLVMAFCYIGIELGLGLWAKEIIGAVGGNSGQAALALALFWLAAMMGRLALGVFYKCTRILGYGMILGACSMLTALLLPGIKVRLVCYFLMGVSASPGWPLISTLALNAAGRYSGASLSLLLVLSSIGGVTMPPVHGLLSATFGIRTVMASIMAFFLVIAALHALYNKEMTRSAEGSPAGTV